MVCPFFPAYGSRLGDEPAEKEGVHSSRGFLEKKGLNLELWNFPYLARPGLLIFSFRRLTWRFTGQLLSLAFYSPVQGLTLCSSNRCRCPGGPVNAYVPKAPKRRAILLALDQPRTPTQISKIVGVSVNNLWTKLDELQKHGMTKCINPERIKGRFYERTKKGHQFAGKVKTMDG